MLNFGEVNGTYFQVMFFLFFSICFFPSDFLAINFLYSDLPVIVLGEKTTLQMFGRETPLSEDGKRLPDLLGCPRKLVNGS